MDRKTFIGNVWEVVKREIRIIRQRPLYLLASVGVIIVNAVFYLTFFRDGLPYDLPVGVVDEDRSSTSRNFAEQLNSTQLSEVIYFDDIHAARRAMQTGRITSFVLIPEHFNNDIQANRRPHIQFYVNSLYFVGGALSYKDLLQMIHLTNGAVQREVLRAHGVNEREIMNRIQPIVIDAHQIGNPTTNYGIYLNNILLPGILAMIVVLITVYTFGAELKYGTSRHLLKVSGDSIVVALTGKMLPYTVLFTILGISLELLLFVWLRYPLAGSVWPMFLDILLMILASQAIGIFIVELLPILRLSISIGAIFSTLGLSLAGFTLPVEAMPRWIGAWSAAFPLRHYYMMFVQEAIYGSGFAGWWQEVVHFLLFLLLPAFGLRRLKSAYTLQNYPRN